MNCCRYADIVSEIVEIDDQHDGAAPLVLASQDNVNARGLKSIRQDFRLRPLRCCVEGDGSGVITAVLIVLERSCVSLDTMDGIEANEAFAAQACAVTNALAFDQKR